MIKISKAVGNNAPNHSIDVIKIQRLINLNLPRLTPFLSLVEDGMCGPVTIGMIIEFQYRIMKFKKPDGKVEPGKSTIAALNKYAEKETASSAKKYDENLLPVQQHMKNADNNDTKQQKPARLVESDYKKAAILLGVDVASIKAVAAVESAGSGFLANGKPKILFEGHQFSRRTKHVYDKSHPTISYKVWTTKFYKKNGINEYIRYNTAKSLDKINAMKSTSWGKFQIMGFNYQAAGFKSIEEFVKAMHESENRQLIAFVNFLKSQKLDIPLRSKNWVEFAKKYNGPGYAKNKYDIRLKQAYTAYSAGDK